MSSAAAGVADAPECPRCKHRHGENNKCKQCGHMGRQVIFPGPGDQHPPPSQFRLVAFDSKTQPEDESTGYLRLAQLMRNQVFIGELKMLLGRESKAASGRRSEIKEVDDHEGVSRHILGIYGDAPVSYARWRVMTIKEVDGSADPGVMVVIDRFLTLPHYRKRGYGKATFGQCLMDILTMMEEAGVAVSRISVFIPAKAECLYAAQTVLKFGLQNVATGPRPTDPTGTANPEFYKDSGVQEFTVSASVLLEAFKSAGGGAGAASVAAGMAGGAAAAAGMGMGMGGAMPTA